jgi:PIN domain nuclease of toxin-antitoxin system
VTKVVLDASALLAVLQLEAGADVIADRLGHAHISVVNLSEVVGKLIDGGASLDAARRIIGVLTLSIEDVDEAMAYAAAALRPATRKAGLSLGDRMCLALAQRMAVPALTTDNVWHGLDVGVEIRVAR